MALKYHFSYFVFQRAKVTHAEKCRFAERRYGQIGTNCEGRFDVIQEVQGGFVMKMLRAILCGFLAVMVWGGATQSAELKENAPAIEVETPIYHFQKVTQGETVKHDFRVFNRGKAPLEIRNVKPG
jgi:hypothetical protein